MTTPPLPVTGAWRPGDDPGRRQFCRIASGRGFVLDVGAVLHDVDIAYETWGRLDADGANAICCATRGPATATPPVRRATATTSLDGGTT